MRPLCCYVASNMTCTSVRRYGDQQQLLEISGEIKTNDWNQQGRLRPLFFQTPDIKTKKFTTFFQYFFSFRLP